MKVNKSEVYKELWYRGQLSWLLYPHQRPIYNKIRDVLSSDDPNMTSYVVDCSRQFGKSFTMFTIAVEECLRNPNVTQVYIAPLKSQAMEIINGRTYGTVFETCPKDLLPVLKDSALIFPNGSRIRIAGTDNHNYENLRGGAAHNIFLDEGGFMSNLEDGVLPTVEPMTKTTGGKVIYSSTPPENLDHDYYEVLRYHEEAELISTFTIWDDRTLTEKQLEKIIQQCKGKDTVKFQREFECKRIADTSKQVVPNFTASRVQINEHFLKDPFYKYWHKYVVADWGGRDKTAVIFAHYNFKTRKVVIEDHIDLDGEKIVPAIIASKIKEKLTNWTESENIYYICDSNNPLVQQEMNLTYRIPFIPTSKGRLDGMVDKLKDWEYSDRIEFGLDAEFVAKSLASAHWNKSRDEFARSKIFGHYDHTAALVYLIRNIDEMNDPVPRLYGLDPNVHHINPWHGQDMAQTRAMNAIFGAKRK